MIAHVSKGHGYCLIKSFLSAAVEQNNEKTMEHSEWIVIGSHHYYVKNFSKDQLGLNIVQTYWERGSDFDFNYRYQ